MIRIDTLRSSLLILVPCLALAACGGGAGEDARATSDDPSNSTSAEQTSAPESEQAAAGVGDAPVDPQENGPDKEVALNVDGVPTDEVGEAAPAPAEGGSEKDDKGYAETLAALTAEEPSNEPTADVGDGVAQTQDALGTWRGAKIIAEAKRIAGAVNRPTSYYTHTTYMNESTGTRRTDCSGLTGYILKRVLPDSYSLVPTGGGTKPLADDYLKYFSGRPTSASTTTTPRWRKISSVKNLKAGDLVTWTYASGENTGHIMIVKSAPREGRASRGEWIVPIIDSTASPHAYNSYDSRGTKYTGVGEGQIGLKIDSTGAPKAYYWTGGTSPTAVYRPIVLARIE